MPQNKRNSVAINCRLDGDLIAKLKAKNPSITTVDVQSGEIKFRHGALGRYVERLIRRDLEERQDSNAAIDELLKQAGEI